MSSVSASADELSSLKDEFLASLNHEIRTPLSGVLGMLDLTLETALTGEQKEYLDDARLCAENLLHILNSTLEFSALSANQVVLEEAEFQLLGLLDGLLDEFAFKAKVQGLKLIRCFARDVPEVACGDAFRLKQILSNVISNAIKFTPKGEVEVKARVSPLEAGAFMLNVTVRDTGIGISEAAIEHVFDSFRQLETGLARRYTGLGLGLAVAQKLVNLMDGEIAVSSRIGAGTEFSIDIPLKFSCELAIIPRLALPSNRGFRILVVDDNSIAQAVARHVLQRHPYEVACVSSGAEALQAARKTHYDLVLMDLQMPGMDGLETAALLRNMREYAETPIVALTANCSPEFSALCAQKGLQGFLAKPVQFSELLNTVETFLPSSPRPPIFSAVIDPAAINGIAV